MPTALPALQHGAERRLPGAMKSPWRVVAVPHKCPCPPRWSKALVRLAQEFFAHGETADGRLELGHLLVAASALARLQARFAAGRDRRANSTVWWPPRPRAPPTCLDPCPAGT